METLIPREDHAFCFYTVALLSPTSTLGALYLVQKPCAWKYVVVACDASVAVSSVVYWYSPTLGLRRNVDKLCVVTTALLHYTLLALHESALTLVLYVLSHWLLYTLSWSLQDSRPRLAAYVWLVLHVVTHVSNVVVYTHLNLFA